MKQSAIGWTNYSGGNLNVVTGCTPVSAGCANCYARSIYERFGKDFSRVETHPDKLARLAKQRFGVPVKDAAGNAAYVSPKREGYKPMCFVCDTGDLFHESVPEDFIMHAITVMEARQDVTWQVLTKRAHRMRRILSMGAPGAVLPKNIWLGCTVENQACADERIPLLLDTPAEMRFLSCEPLLEDLDCTKLGMWLRQGIHWVIVGGESGPKRRDFYYAWARNIVDVCRVMGVPVFFKQAGGPRPGMGDTLPGVGTVKEWPV